VPPPSAALGHVAEPTISPRSGAVVATAVAGTVLLVVGYGSGLGLVPSTSGRATAQGRADDDELVHDLFVVDRTVGHMALAALYGGWLFLVLVWSEGAAVARLRRLLAGAWVVGFVATLAGLGLQAATVQQSGLVDRRHRHRTPRATPLTGGVRDGRGCGCGPGGCAGGA
jgi:hypothetical protein